MRHRWILSCGLLCGVLASAPALAQAPNAREAARALADEAYTLYEAGKYQEAVAAFREADRRFHAPTILLMVARSLDKLGRLREASQVYRSIVEEKLARGASVPFVEAQRTAKDELEALDKRIPTVEIAVIGAPAGPLEITLDGERVEPSQRQQRDPGNHDVVVRAGDRPSITRRVVLQEGSSERVEIDLSLLAPAPLPIAGPSPSGSIVPAAVAFGAGGLGLAIGAVTGALALGKVGTLEDACGPSKQCGKDALSAYNSGHTLATVSTVAFVVGGLGVAGGAVLFFVRPGGGGDPPSSGLVVGPGWLGARGTF